MSEIENYMGRVQAIVWRAAEYVSAAGMAEAQRLVSHGEPAEGLCSLAWAIVNEGVQVPRDLISDIRTHTRSIVDDEHMPPALEEQAV